MFGTSRVLVIVQASELNHYESLSRIHSDDPGVRVILDRRRALSRRRSPALVGIERRRVDRRSSRAQNWKARHLVIETGYT